MTDGLDPIKHVYGEEPSGPIPVPGTPHYAEYEALRSMKEALDGLPQSLPGLDLVDAVKDAALAETLLPLRLAYDDEVAGSELDVDDARMAEFELLRSTKAALDLLPRVQPDASVLAVVKSAAATHALTPILAAYGEEEAPKADSPQYSEYALLSSTKSAVDQLPASRPDASVIAAVIAASKPGAPALKIASDRPARSASVVRRWTPALAMAASLVVVAVTGLWVAQVFPGQDAPNSELIADAQLSTADEAPAFSVPAEPEAESQEAVSSDLANQFPESGQPAVAREPLQGFTAAPAQIPVSQRRSETNQSARLDPRPPASPVLGNDARGRRESDGLVADAVVGFGDVDTNKPVAIVSEWEAGEDVRVLSLRLNQLASSSEGLSWDSPPTQLGAAEPKISAGLDGIRSVRANSTPGRVDVQMRSNEQRDDQ